MKNLHIFLYYIRTLYLDFEVMQMQLYIFSITNTFVGLFSWFRINTLYYKNGKKTPLLYQSPFKNIII